MKGRFFYMSKRVFLFVIDSFGMGELPDAAEFGDKGANTLKSVATSDKLDVPVLSSLGLFNIDGAVGRPSVANPTGSFARLSEKSLGKDTTIGHWEIAGVISNRALPTYPNGFPKDIVEAFEQAVGRKTVCNATYSGTDVIRDFGEHHVKTGDLILYTSADSVFQIAAHEQVVPIKELYEICETARKLLTESKTHAVGRVIARPFVGNDKTDFKRTTNRHDYSIDPPSETMLDILMKNGLETIGVGKIFDIFNGQGVSKKLLSKGNDNGMEISCDIAKQSFEGLAFINLVDFDMVFGHRRNIDGYANCLTEFDVKLKEFMQHIGPQDIVMITADHGCDPGYTKTTDHTREYVPLLVFGHDIKSGINLGTRESFADISATILDYFNIERKDTFGKSFLNEIKK